MIKMSVIKPFYPLLYDLSFRLTLLKAQMRGHPSRGILASLHLYYGNECATLVPSCD